MQAISNDHHFTVARDSPAQALTGKQAAHRDSFMRHGKGCAETAILRQQALSHKKWLIANERLSSRVLAEDRARRKKGARKL